MKMNEMISEQEIQKRLRTRLDWYGIAYAKLGGLRPSPDGTVTSDIKNHADETVFRATVDPYTGIVRPLTPINRETARHV